MTTPEIIVVDLIAFAAEIREGTPVESVLSDLEDSFNEWREQYPEE